MTANRDAIVTSVSRTRRPTMKDVAQLAGVGIKTVSRVINEEDNVSPGTAQRVRAAAEALRYVPDDHAGSLRRAGRQTMTIGLVVSAVDNPFAAAVHRGVEDVATARGVAVFATSVEDVPDREVSAVTSFVRRRVDGLIVTPIAPSQAYLEREVEHGSPLVFVDRRPHDLAADTVVIDNAEAAARATRHLLALGHRRIAFLGDLAAIATARERRQGFLDEMRRAGVRPAHLHVELDLHDEAAARRAVHRVFAGSLRPTAIVSAQNLVTIGVVRGLRDLGLSNRVALVGIDDIMLADLLDPPVTVVAQDPLLIGRHAAERLFARMDGDESEPRVIVVPTTLRVRGSGEIPPVEG